MEWIASLGIAYGGSYLVDFPLRLTRYQGFRQVFWVWFLVTYAVSVAVLYLIPIPIYLMALLGFAGAVMGLALTVADRGAQTVEESQRAGGEEFETPDEERADLAKKQAG